MIISDKISRAIGNFGASFEPSSALISAYDRSTFLSLLKRQKSSFLG